MCLTTRHKAACLSLENNTAREPRVTYENNVTDTCVYNVTDTCVYNVTDTCVCLIIHVFWSPVADER